MKENGPDFTIDDNADRSTSYPKQLHTRGPRCNFPMNPHARPLVDRLVGLFVVIPYKGGGKVGAGAGIKMHAGLDNPNSDQEIYIYFDN